jgi:phosphoglycolate phosphatase-like HAD superfamily hydrolase
MIKTIILDFDGVIVESVDIKTDAFKELFKKYTDKFEQIINYHLKNNALSRYIKFKFIYEDILKKDYTENVKKELGKAFSNIVFQKVIDCPYVSGAEEFLKKYSKKFPLYIVSATPQEELKRIISARQLTKYFKQVFGTPPGNKIDYIKNILSSENIKPNEAIYIGDMLKDFEIAQETGVLFIGRESNGIFNGLDIPKYSNFKDITKWFEDNFVNNEDNCNCR